MSNLEIAQNNNGLVDMVAHNYEHFYQVALSTQVAEAMRRVDRKKFLLRVQQDGEIQDICKEMEVEHISELAYADVPIPIGHGQSCSQPSMVAFMTDSLKLERGMNVLEIGSGCFYSGAIVLEMIGEEGYLVSIEYYGPLGDLAQANAKEHIDPTVLDRRLHLIKRDGKAGFPDKAPYNRIVFTAGVENFMDFDRTDLERQLTGDGMIMVPEVEGSLVLFEYKDHKFQRGHDLGPVRFVPLL